MSHFEYRNNILHCENVPLTADFANQHGTPAFVYSQQAFVDHLTALQDAFSPINARVCYSVKSCSNLSILKLLASHGADFDVVSLGEIKRVRAAAGENARIVFAGVGKTDEELEGALKLGVDHFNVESESELGRLAKIAQGLGLTAKIALRLNPNVDPKTHKYITTGKEENKFGLDFTTARRVLDTFKTTPGLDICGIHTHIGSQITDPKPFRESLQRTLPFIRELQEDGFGIKLFNIGGGYGIDYLSASNPDISKVASEIVAELKGCDLEISLEPGRSISANACVLLTRVIAVKDSGKKRFVIVDTAMNDLARPSLYQAYHLIWPVHAEHSPLNSGTLVDSEAETLDIADQLPVADIVGPICESGDFLGLNRPLPKVSTGDLIAIFSAGAYGFSMASNYNSRPRAAEILVSGDQSRVIRERETIEDLLSHELKALNAE